MTKDLSLYIHIPFCKTICTYCNFLTFAHKNKQIPQYVEALQKEILLKAGSFNSYLVETIYFGGGTPSVLEAQKLEQILQAVQEGFTIIKKPEITVECNPENISLEKLLYYKKIGINRISLGVQSLNPKTLLKVARPHDEKTIFKALAVIKKAEWKNFGMDIIMGLPYQTLKEFKTHIKKLLSYHPTHFSAYFLSYDTKKIDLFIKDCPNESTQIEMYNFLIKKLAQAGFQHYEVSNYAKSGFECQHNLRYWKQQEYLGLGIGAHSYLNGTVSENIRDFESYLKNPNQYEDQYKLDSETKMMDYIMLNLRKASGIKLADFRRKYGKNESKKLVQKSLYYKNTKELLISSLSIKPTEKGFLILDKITKDLI